MADPYEWQGDHQRRYDRGEEDARRAAERHAEQDRARSGERRERQDGDYGSGWYGEEASRGGYPIPGPYGRARERDDRRSGEPSDHDRLSLQAEAERLRGGIERGWRRLKRDVGRAFDEDRHGGPGADPRRGGGMFGGEDRRESLFSHNDGLGARSAGPHRGKGPKGYARTDSRILEDVNDRLADDGRLDATDIEVSVTSGEVTLNGRVASRQDKRRAEDLAEQVSGVKHLQNNLRVRPPEPAPQPQSAPQAQARAAPPPEPPKPH